MAGPFLIPKEPFIMRIKANHSTSSLAPVVLFGIDSNGKPKAARFGKDHAGLAVKAASQLQLRVLASSDPKVAEIAARLPLGRVHATGRTLVPFIRRDLYDKLLAVAPNGGSASSESNTSGANVSRPSGDPPNLPKHWQDIGLGDLVVAQESPDDGWYEAIVADVNGDMLTLRWRDYPRERRIMRHRNQLALLYPGSDLADCRKSTKSAAGRKHDKPTADQMGNAQPLPKDWQAIDANQLVLAKDDGPWLAWWEAVPVEKVSDGFKLRWRDRVNKALFTRPRLELALICPDAT
jgi:hypothetical protein